jgi:uncharacterized cupin superfamily protein
VSVNLFTVPLGVDDDDPPGYHAAYARIGPMVGAAGLGMSVYEIPPGDSICPYHYELTEEEWLIVLAGAPTLRTPEGERVLGPWDTVCFPAAAESGAHKVSNATAEPVRVAMLSTKSDVGVAVYPDSGKVGVWPPGRLFRLADAVDYWDGELET